MLDVFEDFKPRYFVQWNNTQGTNRLPYEHGVITILETKFTLPTPCIQLYSHIMEVENFDYTITTPLKSQDWLNGSTKM